MFTATRPRLSSSFSKVAPEIPTIQLTALYEDLEAGLRAKHLLDRVEATVKIQMPVKFKLEVWRFDWLRELSLSTMALSTARSSALILVSVSTHKPAPPEFQRWIRSWSQGRESQLSTLVLLTKAEHRRHGHHPLHDCLQQAALQKGAEFMCEYLEPVRAEPIPRWAVDREAVFCA